MSAEQKPVLGYWNGQPVREGDPIPGVDPIGEPSDEGSEHAESPEDTYNSLMAAHRRSGFGNVPPAKPMQRRRARRAGAGE